MHSTRRLSLLLNRRVFLGLSDEDKILAYLMTRTTPVSLAVLKRFATHPVSIPFMMSHLRKTNHFVECILGQGYRLTERGVAYAHHRLPADLLHIVESSLCQ